MGEHGNALRGLVQHTAHVVVEGWLTSKPRLGASIRCMLCSRRMGSSSFRTARLALLTRLLHLFCATAGPGAAWRWLRHLKNPCRHKVHGLQLLVLWRCERCTM